MDFFLDTADIAAVRMFEGAGLLDGVTTNPSLVAGAERRADFHGLVKQICDAVKKPVSAEVLASDADEMIAEAKTLAAISEHVVVKLPATADGVKTIGLCTAKGIRTNATLAFQPLQALAAAKAGAAYVSLFLGRLDDIGQDAIMLLHAIRGIYSRYGFGTKILAASIRHPLHVVRAAEAGADAATMPPTVMAKLLDHPLTKAGLDRFSADWGGRP